LPKPMKRYGRAGVGKRLYRNKLEEVLDTFNFPEIGFYLPVKNP